MSEAFKMRHMEHPVRMRVEKYPDYTAEIEALEKDGISDALLRRIIEKHRDNAEYNKTLIDRYEALADGVPIFGRTPRFSDSDDAINHKLNNDFFSEIIDFKTGYFAGNPIGYSYSVTDESQEDTGDAGDNDAEQKAAVDAASKVITDFVTRSNMFDVDMECTKYAAICGYAGRLFYIDKEGDERVMVVPPNECIILSKTRDITHPTYGVRYYTTKDISDNDVVKAEFYDDGLIHYYEGGNVSDLHEVKNEPNLFDGCPLQGIPNNLELKGDAEKVLTLIDAYDRALSDNSNEADAFANAYMVFKNVHLDEKERQAAQAAGSFEIQSNGVSDADICFLTKEINDTFIEHHLDRLEENIYRFSKTPNMSDESFGTASGVSLKFKLTGLETKCGMFEAKMISAGTYMFTLLSKAWAKKTIKIDPLQVVMDFRRNFPVDVQGEAANVQALVAAGLPKAVAYAQLSFVDDVDYVMQLIEEERDSMPSLMFGEDEEGGQNTPFQRKQAPDDEDEE